MMIVFLSLNFRVAPLRHRSRTGGVMMQENPTPTSRPNAGRKCADAVGTLFAGCLPVERQRPMHA